MARISDPVLALEGDQAQEGAAIGQDIDPQSDDAAYLRTQMRGLSRVSIGLMVAGVVGLVTCVLMLIWSSGSAPLKELAQIDVPTGLAEFLNGDVPIDRQGHGDQNAGASATQGAGYGTSAQSAIEYTFGSVLDSGVLKVAAVVAFLMGVGYAIVMQNMGMAVMSVVVAVGLGMMPGLVSNLAGLDVNHGSAASTSGGMVNAMQDAGRRNDLDALNGLIARARDTAGVQGLEVLGYVAAQARAKAGAAVSEGERAWIGSSALKASGADPAVVAFMEHKLTGSAQSALAVNYMKAAQADADSFGKWGAIAGAVSAACLLGALVLYGLVRSMKQRLDDLTSERACLGQPVERRQDRAVARELGERRRYGGRSWSAGADSTDRVSAMSASTLSNSYGGDVTVGMAGHGRINDDAGNAVGTVGDIAAGIAGFGVEAKPTPRGDCGGVFSDTSGSPDNSSCGD